MVAPSGVEHQRGKLASRTLMKGMAMVVRKRFYNGKSKEKTPSCFKICAPRCRSMEWVLDGKHTTKSYKNYYFFGVGDMNIFTIILFLDIFSYFSIHPGEPKRC